MLLIRNVETRDLGAIARIYGHYVRHSTATFELDPPGEIELGRRVEAILSSGLPYLIAEDDTGVIGYAYAGTYRPRPAYRYTVEDSIYLDPSAVGKGTGSRLLTELVERCEATGARQMVAVIGDSANTASIRLHERFDFQHAGVLRSVGLKFGRWIDTVLMQRPLGPGDSHNPSET